MAARPHWCSPALAENQGRVGKFRLRFSVLDDTRGEEPRWDPGQSAANARRAAQDRDAIAYVGEIDSGASAISIPITNEAGILHLSPVVGDRRFATDLAPAHGLTLLSVRY